MTAAKRKRGSVTRTRRAVIRCADPAQQTGPSVQPVPGTLGVAYLPSVHAGSLGEFCAMLKATRPTAAKLVDVDGGMVVTTATRRIYFRNTPHARRALRYYGVAP